MPYSAGVAYLQVVPSFRGIEDELKRQAAEIGKAVDNAVGNGLRNGVERGSRDGARGTRAAGGKAGKDYGGAFAAALKRRLTEAYKSFPKIKDPLTDVERSIKRVQKQIRRALQVPKGEVFDEAGAVALVRRLRRELRDMEREAIGDDRATHNIRQARGEIEALNDMVERARRSGREAGGEYGGAFSRAVRTRINAALQSLPDVHLDDNSDKIARRYAKLRERLERLRDVEIGVDMSDAKFLRKLRKLDADMEAFARSNPTASVDFNIDEARRSLRRLPGMAEEAGEESGNRSGGAFSDTFRRRITQSLRDLPDIEPDFNMTGAQFRIYQLRTQLAALGDMEIGVDIDAADAVAKLQALHAQLATIALTDPDIDVRTNAARAAAELFAVLQMAHRVDREDVAINVNEDGLRRLAANTDIPIHRLGVLIALGASIGPALVPAAAAASVALAGIATAAGAAVAGVGVLVLGLSGVFTAVKALNTYQQDADKSAKSLAQSQVAVANAADSVKSAERNLANTRESVAYSNRRAAQAVADATDAVSDALRDRKRAEDDLVEAIKAAQRADEDRRRAIRGTALDIRQSNLDIAEAKRELDRVLANPRASEEEREQARITYEQRVLQLDELTARQKELAEEQAEWNRTGVQGSDQVKSAQDRLAAANEKVADSQANLASAIEAQHMQQRQGQAQLESATQSLAQAQRSLQQATVNAGVAGGEALDNLKDAMENLSPAGRRFAEFLFGLKDDFLAFRAAAEEGLLPGLQRSLEGLLRYAGPLERFINKVGVAMGEAFEYVVQQLAHPEWQRFFRHLSESAVPAIAGMVRFIETFSRGIASLIVTLSAFNGSMGQGLLDWAEGFAQWAAELEDSQGFQKFLAYVAENGPDVVRLFGEMFEFIKRLVIAAAPVGDKVVAAFTLLFQALNALPLGVLTALLFLIAGFSAAMLLLKLRQVIWNQMTATVANAGRSMTRTFNGIRSLLFGIGGQASGVSRAMTFLGTTMTRVAAIASAASARMQAFFTATATGARVLAVLIGTTRIGAAALAGLSAVAAVVTPRIAAFVSAAATAIGAYRTAMSRLSTVVGTATTRVAAFFTASVTGARVAALVAAATTLSAYRTAVSRLSGLLPAVTARMSAFMTATTARVSVLAAAARSVGTYRAALSGLATALIPVTLRSGTFFATLAAGSVTTGAASAAMRFLSRTWLDARIILATTTTAMQRWYTVTGLAAVATSTWTRAAALMSPLLTRINTMTSLASGAMARLNSSLTVFGVGGTVVRGSLSALTGVVSGFTAAVGAAVTATGRFIGTLTALGTAAAGRTLGALGSLAGFLGGPWGIAITAATLGIFAMISASAKAKQRLKELRDGLVAFAQVFDEGFTPAAYDSAEAMLRQDSNLRRLMVTLREAGFDTREIVSAINGEEQARTNIVNTLDEQIRAELHAAAVARSGADHETVASKAHKDRAEKLKELRTALESAGVSSQRAREIAEDLRVQDVATAEDQKALNDAFRDGARAADILRNAYKSLYGEARNREEALDAERAAYDRLRASVEKNGATLDANTEAGRENRQNVRDRITALADLAAADVAATGTISADTQARIDQLKKELIQMGFNEAEVDKMIKIYLGVPPKILTEIILNGGANAQGELNEVGKKALEMIATYNLSPSDAMIIAKGGIPPGWRGPSPSALAQAEGGHIRGPGTETSDSIPALLSDNEFVEPAHAVRHYGPQLFEALRHHRIPKEMLPGYARGGIVDSTGVARMATGGWVGVGGRKHTQKADVTAIPSWQMLKDYNKKLLAAKLQELETNYNQQFAGGGDPGDVGAGPGFPPWPRAHPGRGGPSGDSGVWKSILNLVRQAGIPYSFGNAYRRGDPLWHGAGRAIDFMGYNQDRLAQFFMGMRPRILELIHWTNKAKYGITRGRPASMRTQGPLHRNHLHVAMDDGGWLQPGWNSIFNGLGKPEAVLTPPQSAALVQIARTGMNGAGTPRTVNNIHFLDTTLDAGKLHAMNRAEAAYSRTGRAR